MPQRQLQAREELDEASDTAVGVQSAERFKMALALFFVYFIWGSGYLAIRIAIQTIPPLLVAGGRQLLAGGLLYLLLRGRGEPALDRSQWWACARIGLLLMVIASGGGTLAQKWVDSGIAAVVFATSPVWGAIAGALLERAPSRLELGGVIFGIAAVTMLNAHSGLRGQPLAAAILMLGSVSWGVGSVLSRHLKMPSSAMASAAMMLFGGCVLVILAFVVGERPSIPSWNSLGAFFYLAILSSLLGFSAFTYLMRHASPALTLSHAYVNPAVAVLMGAVFAGEQVGGLEVAAIALTTFSVLLLTLDRANASAVMAAVASDDSALE